MNTKSMLLAAGLGGVAMAFLTAVPLVGIFGSCCCLWAGLWGSGILSVWIYRQTDKTLPALSVGQGVLLGLLAGVVGAVLGSIFGGLVSLISGGVSSAAYLDYMNQVPGMSEYMNESSRQMIEQFASTGSNILVSTLCNFVLYPVFGMIGGLIGTALIWKKQ
jgi:hypothetical protein